MQKNGRPFGKNSISAEEIKHAARGREIEILEQVAGLNAEVLDGRHHPCPGCGGQDRFRLFDEVAGAVLCNQCFKEKNGDFLAAICHYKQIRFHEAIKLVADHIGYRSAPSKTASSSDIVELVAKAHGLQRSFLLSFGAQESRRGKLKVCRVPMYSAQIKPCGWFDMATISKDWTKGRNGARKEGSKQGLFIPTGWEPNEDEVIHITEGVKDAAALHSLGFTAIGMPGKRIPSHCRSLFTGLNVIIIPDRDKPGEEAAIEEARVLSQIAASVKIGHLPGEIEESGGNGIREILKLPGGIEKIKNVIDSTELISESEDQLNLIRHPDGRDTAFTLSYYGSVISDLSSAELTDSRKLYQRISEITYPRLDLPKFDVWWHGPKNWSDKNGPRPEGVFRRLLQKAENIELAPEESRRAYLAGWLLSFLLDLKLHQARSEDEDVEVYMRFDDELGTEWTHKKGEFWGTRVKREFSKLVKSVGAYESKREGRRVFVFKQEALTNLRILAGEPLDSG